jgi:hypothetical protein
MKNKNELLMHLFWALAIFFNAIMDTIMFHPWSWLLKVIPSFRAEFIFWVIDPWHIAKILMQFCFFMSMYFAYRVGFWYADIDFKHKFFWRTLITLGCLTTFLFNELLHLIF